MKDLDTLQVCDVVVFDSVWSDLLVLHNYRVIISECEHEVFGPVPDQANQSRFYIYLINFQPLWDQSQINLKKLFNAQNGQIDA